MCTSDSVREHELILKGQNAFGAGAEKVEIRSLLCPQTHSPSHAVAAGKHPSRCSAHVAGCRCSRSDLAAIVHIVCCLPSLAPSSCPSQCLRLALPSSCSLCWLSSTSQLPLPMRSLPSFSLSSQHSTSTHPSWSSSTASSSYCTTEANWGTEVERAHNQALQPHSAAATPRACYVCVADRLLFGC